MLLVVYDCVTQMIRAMEEMEEMEEMAVVWPMVQ